MGFGPFFELGEDLCLIFFRELARRTRCNASLERLGSAALAGSPHPLRYHPGRDIEGS